MKRKLSFKTIILLLLICNSNRVLFGQTKEISPDRSNSVKFKKASKKIEIGVRKDNQDTLAQGYFDLGETYYQQGDALKSEDYFKKAKALYEKINSAEGIAKSSRALAKVQEDLNKKKEATFNYSQAQTNNLITGDSAANTLNANDMGRLSIPDSSVVQQRLIQDNIKLSIEKKDTAEIISNYSRLGNINLKLNNTQTAVGAFQNAYHFSNTAPLQAMLFNQQITDVYLKEKNFTKAIETKQGILKAPFLQNSTQWQAKEIASLADIYLQKKDDNTALKLLNDSYALSVKNGHTLQAKECVEKLDSILESTGQKEKSLALYKNFLAVLPAVIKQDSSLIDTKVIAETEIKIKELENEKLLKDDLIRRKNIFNYWLMGFIAVLLLMVGIVINMLRKLRTRNFIL